MTASLFKMLKPLSIILSRRVASNWQRRFAMLGIIAADLFCFVVLYFFSHQLSTPLTLQLFNDSGVRNTGAIVDIIVFFMFFFVGVRYLAGDYSRRQLFWDGARSTTSSLLVFGGIHITLLALIQSEVIAPMASGWLVLIILLPIARHGIRLVLRKIGLWYIPTAIIGNNKMSEKILSILRDQVSLGLKIIWVVSEKPNINLSSAYTGIIHLILSKNNLVPELTKLGCQQVVIVPDGSNNTNDSEIINQMVGVGITVSIIPPLQHLPLYGLSANYSFSNNILILLVRNNLARIPQKFIKRTIDLVMAVVAFLLLIPVFSAIAFFIWKEDRGPIFFFQKRVGRNSKEFFCWKFRTMAPNAEEQMSQWETNNPELLKRYNMSNFKLHDDPRITRIGLLLRGMSLDELPQLINVILGDMSLVGPRPLLRKELPEYGVGINLYERVRPGITGLWQISGRSETTFSDRISYDEWYIKNWSIWSDLVIILKTFPILFHGRGAF